MVDTTLTFRNRWIASVDGAARRTPGWAAVLLAIALLALGFLGGGRVYGALPAPGPGYPMLVVDRLLQIACILAPPVAGAWIMLHLVERRTLRGWAAPAQTALAAGAGAALFLAALGLTAAFGATALGGGHATLAHRLLGVSLGALLVLVQAGAEEYVFRGWLQPVLAARWGPVFGLVGCALLFAAAHAALSPLSPVAFLNDTLAGLAFGLFALRSGGLSAAVAAHWGWNWAEQSLVGATPNPGVDPLGSLFDVDLRGPDFLGGGTEEMNGSVCATLALLALIAVAMWLTPRLVAPRSSAL